LAGIEEGPARYGRIDADKAVAKEGRSNPDGSGLLDTSRPKKIPGTDLGTVNNAGPRNKMKGEERKGGTASVASFGSKQSPLAPSKEERTVALPPPPPLHLPLIEGLTAEEAEAIREARTFPASEPLLSTTAEKAVPQQVAEGQTAEEAEESRLSRLGAADEAAESLKAKASKAKSTTAGIGFGKAEMSQQRKRRATESNSADASRGLRTKKYNYSATPSVPLTEGLTAEEAEAMRNARFAASEPSSSAATITPKKKKLSPQVTEGQTAEEAEESRLSRIAAADEAAKTLKVAQAKIKAENAEKANTSATTPKMAESKRMTTLPSMPLKATTRSPSLGKSQFIGSADVGNGAAKDNNMVGKQFVPSNKSKGTTLPTKAIGVASLPKVPINVIQRKAPLPRQSGTGAGKFFSVPKGKGETTNEEKYRESIQSPLKGKGPQLKPKSNENAFVGNATPFIKGKVSWPEMSRGGGFLSNFGKKFFSQSASNERANPSPDESSVPYGLGAGKAKSHQPTPFAQPKAKSSSILKGEVGAINGSVPYGLGEGKGKTGQPPAGKMIAKSIIAGSGPNASQSFSPATQSNPSLFEGGTINKMKGEETKKSSSLTSFKLKQRPSTGDEPEIK